MIGFGLLIIVATFFFMEFVAWFTHKYVMHGLLWKLHRDHHVKENEHHVFEKNDSFFLIFAIPAMALFAAWGLANVWWAIYPALGITLYGAAYFFVHDLFIHQRARVLRHTDNSYLKAIRKAHKVHHKHLTKEDGECFGMLWVPLKFFREYFSK